MSIDLSAAVKAGMATSGEINPRLYAEGDVRAVVSQAAVVAAAPLIEAAVRAEIEAAVEADAASIAKAAEGWRASEQHPVNSPAAARYDRMNAEAREAMAKHLRTVTIPVHVRGAA